MLVVRTPLRLSFLGGGTDFRGYFAAPGNDEGGAVVGTTLDKYVSVILKRSFDERIHLTHTEYEVASTPDDLRHSLTREALRLTGVTDPLDITILSDVPSDGSGLGSSSSVTVALLHAFWSWLGEHPTPAELAEAACKIELDLLGRPMGVQDAYFAAFGGFSFFRFGPADPHQVVHERVRLTSEVAESLEVSLLLYFTNRTRNSSSILASQLQNIPDRGRVLDHLRDLAEEGRHCLERAELNRFGRLLHEGWRLKKQMADGISDSAIEALYEAALEAGALGGKIAGAGGGGFLLLYVPVCVQDQVRARLRPLAREVPLGFDRDGSRLLLDTRGSAAPAAASPAGLPL
jgi:D-glycero-alpha-D-manno-heptose-7-phosphate kinase